MLLDVHKVDSRRSWRSRCFSKSAVVSEVRAVGVPRNRPKRVYVCTRSLALLPSSYIGRNKLIVLTLSVGADPTGIVMADSRFAPQSLAGDTVAYPALGELEDTTEVVAGQDRLGRPPTSGVSTQRSTLRSTADA
jgi:hypothetical protein